MDDRWRIDTDALACGELRLALQRIGAGHWQPGGTLRSWGLAQLHRDGDRVCAPCGDREVLWIGCWLQPPETTARVAVHELGTRGESWIDLPGSYSLTSLDRKPFARRAAESVRCFVLEIVVGRAPSSEIELRLMEPSSWSALSGRSWSQLSDEPPPLPPRLG